MKKIKLKPLSNDKIKVGETSKISLKMAIIFNSGSSEVPGNVEKKPTQ